MRISSFVRYFFAGVFFTNSMPHLLAALTGRRNRTPFGLNSSAPVNLLWSGINLISGYLLVRFADRREGRDKASSKAWQIPYEMGCLLLSIFGIFYSWRTAGQELRQREA